MLLLGEIYTNDTEDDYQKAVYWYQRNYNIEDRPLGQFYKLVNFVTIYQNHLHDPEKTCLQQGKA